MELILDTIGVIWRMATSPLGLFLAAVLLLTALGSLLVAHLDNRSRKR